MSREKNYQPFCKETSCEKLKSAGIHKCEIKNITGYSMEKGLDDYDSGDEKEQ